MSNIEPDGREPAGDRTLDVAFLVVDEHAGLRRELEGTPRARRTKVCISHQSAPTSCRPPGCESANTRARTILGEARVIDVVLDHVKLDRRADRSKHFRDEGAEAFGIVQRLAVLIPSRRHRRGVWLQDAGMRGVDDYLECPSSGRLRRNSAP
ncbi:hypothetical protein GGE24_007411 [Bradyrhizobium centrosematis]|nr:hypothetical protein [Bradyrhizobium centrosematis]MCS3778036.1 hypothetical protein [Bradyrhizobium centrosematis]